MFDGGGWRNLRGGVFEVSGGVCIILISASSEGNHWWCLAEAGHLVLGIQLYKIQAAGLQFGAPNPFPYVQDRPRFMVECMSSIKLGSPFCRSTKQLLLHSSLVLLQLVNTLATWTLVPHV